MKRRRAAGDDVVGLVQEHGSYERRRPELTLLHQVVSEYLESFLAEARADGRKGLPRYVEVELREYLECGILARGFELEISFSAKSHADLVAIASGSRRPSHFCGVNVQP